MTKKEFVELIEYIKPKLDEYIKTTPYDMLSFFELTEAIGFLYFAKKKVDWVVLEVACGGRYDSSNIIPYKDVAVITNIGLDHVGVIGNNKEEIAYEKAGIIKPGCAVFTSEKNKKILDIIQAECEKKSVSLQVCKFASSKLNYKLNVLGNHQVKNAILCTDISKHLGISDTQIKRGLMKVQLPIRMEVVSTKPLIILDGAHNPDKIKSTVATTKQVLKLACTQVGKSIKKKPYLQTCKLANLQLIVGFSADKNINKMISQLATLKPQTIACTRFTNNHLRKVANPAEISRKFKKLLPKTNIEIFLDPEDALNWSKQKKGLILATGSIFLAGELRAELRAKLTK